MIVEREYKTRKYYGNEKSLTRCPFHQYIKIGSGACYKCMCYEGKSVDKKIVRCSFPE